MGRKLQIRGVLIFDISNTNRVVHGYSIQFENSLFGVVSSFDSNTIIRHKNSVYSLQGERPMQMEPPPIDSSHGDPVGAAMFDQAVTHPLLATAAPVFKMDCGSVQRWVNYDKKKG